MVIYKQKLWPFVFIITLLYSHVTMAMRAHNYIASIPPLASLLGGLLQDIEPAECLLNGQISPHTYTIKPSDIKKIQNADFVFWLGPTYEFFLKKILETYVSQHLIILDLPTLITWAPRNSKHNHDCCHGNHSHDTRDPHVWLNPLNAIIIAAAMRDTLSTHDPRHRQQYADNFKRLEERLQQLHQTLMTQLAPFKNQPFMVFHDGYQYFERAYGLRNEGVFAVNPEHSLSVKHVDHLARHVKETKLRCVFAENQFKPVIINKFAIDHNLIVKTIDPLGTIVHGDERDYIATMLTLGQTFTDCFNAAAL